MVAAVGGEEETAGAGDLLVGGMRVGLPAFVSCIIVCVCVCTRREVLCLCMSTDKFDDQHILCFSLSALSVTHLAPSQQQHCL